MKKAWWKRDVLFLLFEAFLARFSVPVSMQSVSEKEVDTQETKVVGKG